VPARSRAPAKSKRVRTAARVKAPCGKRFTGDWCAPRPPSDSGIGIRKSPRPVSRRGLNYNFCDDEDMPVICPTGQVLFLMALPTRSGCERRQPTAGADPHLAKNAGQKKRDGCTDNEGNDF
jgi:hypothetical protein